MTLAPYNPPPQRKGTNVWVIFIFLLAVAGAGAYLGLQDIDWKEKLASLQQAATQPPPAPPSAPTAGEAITPPSFDAVSADGGMLVAAGKAQPGALVLLQNGGQTLADGKADENGEWVIMMEKPLPPGPYELSIVAVDPKTQTRMKSRKTYALTIAPQDRKVPVQTAAAPGPASGGLRPASVNVKRGDTLWGIAEQFYGRGMGARYPEIAGANKEQIKNPDLIFPQQQFTIPEKKAP